MDNQVKAGMLCPVCRVDLMMSDRQGIEIDFCPKCRGVWLDRGELDKIIERSVSHEPPEQSAPAPYPPVERPAPGYGPGGEYRYGDDYRRRDDYRHRDDDDRHGRHDPRRRRKSFLGELFDFD